MCLSRATRRAGSNLRVRYTHRFIHKRQTGQPVVASFRDALALIVGGIATGLVTWTCVCTVQKLLVVFARHDLPSGCLALRNLVVGPDGEFAC